MNYFRLILLLKQNKGPGWLNDKPITNTGCVRARLFKLQKGALDSQAARDKVY